MPSYIHSTPAILTSRFFSKSQVKDSELCGLIDDNFPDDIFSLRGALLEIQEGDGTLNKDFALAIGFNQIQDQESANQIAKLLIANGPALDSTTIEYYVTRLSNGPYGDYARQVITDSFLVARSAGLEQSPGQFNLGNGNNLDQDFISFLRSKLGAADCFLTPANYFEFQGIYATLAQTKNIWNYTTAPVSDTNGKETRGYELPETTDKMPNVFQAVAIGLNFLTLNIFRKVLKTSKTKQELEDEKTAFQSGKSVREDKPGTVTTSDITTAIAVQESSVDVQSQVMEQKGDLARISKEKKANPYAYSNQQPAAGNNASAPMNPGTTAMPPETRTIPNVGERLGTARVAPVTEFTAVPLRKTPVINQGGPYVPSAPTYDQYTRGESAFTSVLAHSSQFKIGDEITMNNFDVNNTPVKMLVIGYTNQNNQNADPSRVQVLVDAASASLGPNQPTANSDKPPGTPGSNNTSLPPAFTGKSGKVTKKLGAVSQECKAFLSGQYNSNGVVYPNPEIVGNPGLPSGGLTPNYNALGNPLNARECITGANGYCLTGVIRGLREATGNEKFDSGYEGAVRARFFGPLSDVSSRELYKPEYKRWYWEQYLTNSDGQPLFTRVEYHNSNPGRDNFASGLRDFDVAIYNRIDPTTGTYTWGHAEFQYQGNTYSNTRQSYGTNAGGLPSGVEQGRGYFSDVTVYRLNYLESYK